MVQKRANVEFFYTKQSGYWLDIRDLDVIKLKVKTGHSMMVQTELLFTFTVTLSMGTFLFKT